MSHIISPLYKNCMYDDNMLNETRNLKIMMFYPTILQQFIMNSSNYPDNVKLFRTFVRNIDCANRFS